MGYRIGVDISDLATGRADGTTRYTRMLAQFLPVIGREYEWHYFAPGSLKPHPAELLRGETAGSSGTRNVHTHISAWPKYWTQLRLPWELYRYRPDVLFMPIQQLPYVRPRRMKTVAVIHDLAVHYYPDQFTRKDWLLLHVFSAQAARDADALICVSHATANDVAILYGREHGVHVVHHGVDHEHFRLPTAAEREDARQRIAQEYPRLRKPYVLFVGQIQPRKNLVRLIEAFELLAAHDNTIQLVIGGGHGWKNAEIKRRAGDSPFASRVHLLGRVPEAILPALYWQAEVMVLPSLYEGFGMPILEAMACGCPVVTSNVSSLPEVAGSAAVLVDPLSSADIARGITAAHARRDELVRAGTAQAGKFTWDHTAKATLEVLRGLR